VRCDFPVACTHTNKNQKMQMQILTNTYRRRAHAQTHTHTQTPTQEHMHTYSLMSQSLKKTFITTVLTAVKKNKQPTLAHTPGGPGRLRSWSGPVETDFQGRPIFSSDNMPENPPPKPYLPLQTRTRHRRSHRPHVPMLMWGTTPPTIRSLSL